MAKKKSDDHNTATKTAQLTQAAIAGVDVPSWLSVPDEAKPFFSAILKLRDYASWNESDLAKAANLARAQADIERIGAEIREEGDVVVNDRGTQIPNPKHAILETLTRRELALSRAVHVHAEATQGKSRDAGPKSRAQQAKIYAIDNAREKAKGLIPGI